MTKGSRTRLRAATACALVLMLQFFLNSGPLFMGITSSRDTSLLWLLVVFPVVVVFSMCWCCCSCFVCSCLCARRAVLSIVRRFNTRKPCPLGLECESHDELHLSSFSHAFDDDYGFAVRIHGGIPTFATLRQCFNFMDPHQRGYVHERAALRELLSARRWTLKDKVMLALRSWSVLDWSTALLCFSFEDRVIRDLWKLIDTDGNGYISFPEFVEWALGPGQRFGFPQRVGVVGAAGKAGRYTLPCALNGCLCTNFQRRSSGADILCSAPGCGHHRGYHAASPSDQILAVLPRTWTVHPDSKLNAQTNYNSDWALQNKSQLVACNDEVIAQIQQLMDASVKVAWTRDRGRRNKVPLAYEVVRVDRNENVRAWLKFVVKKALMVEALAESTPAVPYKMRTSQLGQTLPLMELERPDEKLNEWYLWHGVSSAGAAGIAATEFKQSLAGSATGTLYGRGTYLSDSCTKADEYAKEIQCAGDAGLFCLLLCRVVGGRVRYTDEVAPNAVVLEKEVLEGEFDCVLGDREKCRNTFKEIVIYESTQAYPEYLVYYKRKYQM